MVTPVHEQFIEQKNEFYKRFIRSNKTLLYIDQFKMLQDELSFLMKNLLLKTVSEVI